MAKQKSGLGRGLNALFDESPRPSAPEPKRETPVKVKTEAAAPVKKEPAAPAESKPAENQGVLHRALRDRANATARKNSSSSDIYISEEALENAKVVSRETKKTPHQVGSGTTARAVKRPEPQPKPVIPAEKRAGTVSERPVVQKAAASKAVKPTEAAPAKPKDAKGETGIVKLAMVQPNPDQPRTNFKPEEIEELAGSIKKEGLLQPILVRKVGDHYQIIAGERRWQACKSLGMEEVPVRFWNADNDKALELALIENIQRSDLNPIEEAYGYKRLMERKGMTQSELAKTVSKGRSTIANALRLLDLPEQAQQLLFEGKITAGHARAILSVNDPEGRKKLTEKLMSEKLSVRQTEQIARLMSGREKALEEGKAKRVPAPASFKKAAKGLTRFLSAPVRVKTVQGKNKIEIQFKDEEELQRIMDLISTASEK